jgi:hypothetical protein
MQVIDSIGGGGQDRTADLGVMKGKSAPNEADANQVSTRTVYRDPVGHSACFGLSWTQFTDRIRTVTASFVEGGSTSGLGDSYGGTSDLRGRVNFHVGKVHQGIRNVTALPFRSNKG